MQRKIVWPFGLLGESQLIDYCGRSGLANGSRRAGGLLRSTETEPAESDHFFASIRTSASAAASRSNSFSPAGNLFMLKMYATRSAYCRVLRLPGSSEGIVFRSSA